MWKNMSEKPINLWGKCHLLTKVGLGFDRTNLRFPGIQFTKQFIEFVLLETNQFFVSISNVILTRQTCGHRSSKVAGSKRRALVFYFSGARRKPPARAASRRRAPLAFSQSPYGQVPKNQFSLFFEKKKESSNSKLKK